MAKRIKVDRALNSRLDELEQRMFMLKIAYEKYFNGIDKIEPLRERDGVKNMIRELLQENITNTIQKYRFRQLRARANILDLYLQRNLVMIERGTHPKMQFRAGLKERQQREMDDRRKQQLQNTRDRADKQRKEDAAFRQIFDSYMKARKKCGQSTSMEYESVQKTLRNQVRNIKGRYKCNSVSFRVQIEDGKARLKAVPKR
ncbi:MAG: hypothetical protein GY913_17250 [Proteobacteria bacterium]|nr:hypothetical protein [Pseudomonadota bacterium]MCP4918653.1 hypothetical protein [Pseudomonadota bacterium]